LQGLLIVLNCDKTVLSLSHLEFELFHERWDYAELEGIIIGDKGSVYGLVWWKGMGLHARLFFLIFIGILLFRLILVSVSLADVNLLRIIVRTCIAFWVFL
jgi:hypothetical protein